MRKLFYTFLILLIVVFIILVTWSKRVDSKSIVPVLNNFYSDFIDKDYSNMYKYTDFSIYASSTIFTNEGKVSLAQGLLNNDRHWYGNIQRYSINRISWRGIDQRSATVAVTTLGVNGDEQTLYDEVIIKRIGSNWFITEYNSGSPWRTMKMP
ncbi:hypothetical protein GCM10008018_45040 [Paenibacillus marchantiophytorum]|uniref:DUF4878 domain-containing protein n=1 Tax=Paenibacillus marchantiophytorum TaxID=1619310 RepID=A0ABQ1EYY3_9BACL|nr:hypothetical protein [Paenibacillus marchantiophytorum]GFZ93591.1 hypothetical protein GCM10008018_45040 [Paenibacillus marchantiophytorum]